MSQTFEIGSGAMRKATMEMQHDIDPKDELLAKIGDISELELFHNLILVAMYIRPEKTKSGLYLADMTRKEDEYQGKVGLVLKIGPMAFKDDDVNRFGDQSVAVGQWVGFRTSDGFQLTINGVLCRMIQDTQIKTRVPRPDYLF